jgi:hypothetical protein
VIWEIPESLSLWETVATLCLARNQIGVPVSLHSYTLQHSNLIDATEGVIRTAASGTLLAYKDAALAIEANTKALGAQLSYPEMLAMCSDVKLPMRVEDLDIVQRRLGIMPEASAVLDLKFQFPEPSGDSRGIVLCPYTFRPELQLPIPTWQAVVRMLRTFDQPVYVLGNSGQRFDDGMFTENDILSEASVLEKLALLESSALIVGVPNEWLWMATAWEKKTIYFYPDSIPARRWFWHKSDNCGRCEFTPGKIETALILTGLRMLMNGMK